MTLYVAKVIIVGALLIALAILLTACAVYTALRALLLAGRAVATWLRRPTGPPASPDDLVIAMYERELSFPLSDSYLAPGEDFR